MTWSEDAARALAETFEGAYDAPGVATAAACTDEAGTAIQVTPGDTPADGRFEIGSVTKTMTATLLTLLEADGRLRLDDEVGRWLSAGDNGGITLRQLATHTSGLPRRAPNHNPRANPAQPWAGFGFAQAEEGLRQAVLAPGHPHVYSNHGYHLLGLVLERACGLSYQELVTERLLEPLAMTCSGVGSSGGGTPLPGHANGREVPHWEQPLGPGGIEATIGDLSRYARACLAPPDSPLGAAIAAAHIPQVPLPNGGHQALGWRVRQDGVRTHGGGTGGFTAVVFTDPGRGRAIAMLTSCGHAQSLGQAGLLALTDGDPRAARPLPPGTDWEARAREIVQLLLDGQAGEVHARATATVQDQISVEQVNRDWLARTHGLGPAGEVQVVRRQAGLIVTDAEITFAKGALTVRIVFSPTGQIANLRLLPTRQEPPP